MRRVKGVAADLRMIALQRRARKTPSRAKDHIYREAVAASEVALEVKVTMRMVNVTFVAL